MTHIIRIYVYIVLSITYTGRQYLRLNLPSSPKMGSFKNQGSVGALFVELRICARRQATADEDGGQCLDHVRHLQVQVDGMQGRPKGTCRLFCDPHVYT